MPAWDRLLERRRKQARFRDPERSLDTFDFTFNKKMDRALVYELATGAGVTLRVVAHEAPPSYLPEIPGHNNPGPGYLGAIYAIGEYCG